MRYNLTLTLNCPDKDDIEYYNGPCEYVKHKFDDIKITNKVIEINFSRGGRKDLKTIILNDKSTINQQINKCICYLYGISGKKLNIKNIIISNLDDATSKYTYIEINQPFKYDLPLKYMLTHNVLKNLFVLEDKTSALLIALTLFYKSLNEDNQGNRFNELWKAFNSLYSTISSSNTEFEKLKDMRKFININSNCFTNSFNIIDSHTKDSIRQLLIRDMILNNFESVSKTKALHDTILRFEDYRLNEMFNETLAYRKDFLISEGLLTNVQDHINSMIVKCKKNNEELLCFYILKYCYFLRNKYFHAEKIDTSFHIVDTVEILNIGFVNEIFYRFVHDLITCNDKY